jgi:hypothetical protein
VNEADQGSVTGLVEAIEGIHRRVSASHRELFSLIVEADRRKIWWNSGARDMAHWLSMRHGISWWKARRWVAAAHALGRLPRISEAFARGHLGVDKVVELTRFATPETEAGLLKWASNVSVASIRRKGDLVLRPSIEEDREAERSRSLSWWYTDHGRRFGLQADLPAAQGAVVAKALERVAESVPVMPGEEDPFHADARRADALVAVCSARIARDSDPDRATVVIHAPLQTLISGNGGCEVEGGPVIHPETARRLLCAGRIQTVVEDERGNPVRLGRVTREPPAWMLRQLRYRDRECTFPGCGARRFTQAHHILWWDRGGTTDLDNLLLVCSFHHKLVHEHGWTVRWDGDGPARWFQPDGTSYRAGPGPPHEQAVDRELAPRTVASGSSP